MSLLKKSLVSTLFASSLFLVSINSTNDVVIAATQTPPVAPSTEQPAGDPPSGENVEANEVIEEIEAQTPASVTGETMQGNGTVVDYTTSGSKAFYTIVDTEQNTFYLIIDMDKTQNNVYFLKDVKQSDLDGVATTSNSSESVAPTPPPNLAEPEAEVQPEESNSGLGFALIVLLLAGIGVAAYYFLVMRKRHQNKEEETEDDEMSEYYDDDFEDEETEVDLSKKDK